MHWAIGNRLRWAVYTCLLTSVCLFGQSFPTPDAPAQTTKKAQSEQGTDFKVPETATTSGAARPAQQDTDFKAPVPVSDAPVKSDVIETASLGTNPLLGSARKRFAEARKLLDIRIEGSSPFHMHAIFSAQGEAELANGGTYTELWLNPAHWRREAVCGSIHVLESRNGDELYRKVSGADNSPRGVDDLLDALDRTYPALDETFVEEDWQQGSLLYEGASVLRVAMHFNGNVALPDARAFWFETNGNLHASYENGTVVEYADYESFKGKQVAHHLNLRQDGTKVAGIWIDEIGESPSETGTQFTIDGVDPIPLSDKVAYSGPYFVPPHPVHQVSPKDPPPGEGTIFVDVHLDAHGHVRAARVKQGINAALDEAATKAAMQWEFAPAFVKGRPTPSDATVQFVF